MAQGGLHRGVAVCRSNPDPPATQPAPGLVSVFPVPQPITPRASAQVHHGWGPSARIGGHFDARPGLGMGLNQVETAARPGQGCEPTATVLTAPGRWHLPAASSVWVHVN